MTARKADVLACGGSDWRAYYLIGVDISSGRAAKKEWWNCPLSLIHRYLRFRTGGAI